MARMAEPTCGNHQCLIHRVPECVADRIVFKAFTHIISANYSADDAAKIVKAASHGLDG